MTISLLIIEDEDKIARLLELELTHEGYEVDIARSGREGLEKVLTKAWDVVLLDIMLPELNGLEVLRRIRNADLSTPIILITARDATPDKVSGLDLGANDYITKPFEIEEVLARIRSCLRKANQVLTREQIINQVWGFDFVGDTNVVDVYVRYLRKKVDYPFKQQLIQTYRGVGYCIKENK